MRRFHTTGGNASRQRKFYESKNHFSRHPGGNNHRKKCNGRPLPKQPLYPHLCRGNYTKRIRQSKHSPGAIHTTTNRHKNSGKHLYPGPLRPGKKISGHCRRPSQWRRQRAGRRTLRTKLAENGYITIAFDAAYQGASGGEPRYTDKPQNRIEDIRAAADYISQYLGTDSEHLGLLGICGGGGYAIKAAQTDKRFKSVATLSMFNTGDARRNGYLRSQKDTIQQRLAAAAAAREKEIQTGEIQYTPEFGAGMTPEQVAAITVDLYRQGYEYYADSHFHPNSKTNSTVSSLLDLMEFDVNTNVDLIDQPLLMIAGEKADSLYMTEEVFANATGTDNKELFKIPGATHIETYWKPEYVKQAVDKLTTFFGKHL